MTTSRGRPATARPAQDSGLTGTIGLGRIGGVPLRAHWSVLVIMALIWVMLSAEQLPAAHPRRPVWQYVIVGGIAAAVFLLGLLAHEGAHAAVARRNGVRVGTVTLWMLGGFTELKSEAATPGAEWRIAGAGPLTSLLLGLGFGAVAALGDAAHWPAIVLGTLMWLAVINVALGLFNVLPGAPLDGGRLLRATLWKWRGDRTWATIAAARAGRVLGVALVVLGALEFIGFRGDASGLWLALIGWFVMGSARSEEEQARLGQELSGVRVRDVMTPSPETASPDLTVAEFIETHLLASRHTTVPLVEGTRPVGLVTLASLGVLPAHARVATTLREIARPMSEVPVALPDEPLTDLVPRLRAAPDHRVLVLDEGSLVGIVTPTDIDRAVEVSRMRQPVPAPTGR